MLLAIGVAAAVAAKSGGLGWFVTVYYTAGIIVALGVLLGGSRLLFKSVVPVWRDFKKFLLQWTGEPATKDWPERPGVITRLQTIEFDVKGMKAELHPDHGKSMRDEVTELVNWKRGNEDLSQNGR